MRFSVFSDQGTVPAYHSALPPKKSRKPSRIPRTNHPVALPVPHPISCGTRKFASPSCRNTSITFNCRALVSSPLVRLPHSASTCHFCNNEDNSDACALTFSVIFTFFSIFLHFKCEKESSEQHSGCDVGHFVARTGVRHGAAQHGPCGPCYSDLQLFAALCGGRNDSIGTVLLRAVFVWPFVCGRSL